MTDAAPHETDAAALVLELREVQAQIDQAYWAFTRQARARPPSLVVPAAYARRAVLEAALQRMRQQSLEEPPHAPK